MRSALAVAIAIAVASAACSGSSKPDHTTPPSPEPGETAGDPVVAPRAEEPPPPAVDATPDTPTGAAAARDAELAVIAGGFIEAFVNSEPVLTRDKRVVFVSNRDGLPQLYIADAKKPQAEATRLVTTTERVSTPLATPDGKAIVFMSDTGADENWSLFRVGLDGKDLVELTPGAKLHRDNPFIPDGKLDTMFFSAREVTGTKTTVWSAPAVVPGEPVAVWSDDQPGFLFDVSRDGKRLLVNKVPAWSDNHLFVVDVASGKSTQVYPTDTTKVSITDAKFSPDGRRIYVGTDGGADQALLLALDAKTGKVLAKREMKPATAQIFNLLVPDKGGLVAVSLVAGNHAELRLFDGTKLAPKAAIDLPLGQGFANGFSEDGKQLAAQWSTPKTPTDVLAIDTRTGVVSPLRDEPRPTLTALPDIEATIVDIPAFDGGVIPTNVYMSAAKTDAKRPVLVNFHGGPAGTSVIQWKASTAFYLSLGYVIVEPNVRGSSGFGRAFAEADNGPKRLDAFKDVETASRWVAKQPWADPDRLVVTGGSYGGYTVLIALSRWPDIWRAGIDLYGIANLETFMKTTSGLIRELFLVEFGDPDKDAAFLREISPITDVDKIVDPTYVYAGANDPRVPRTESDLIVAALRARKVPTEYMVADNEGHSLARRENQVANFARCARFLETHLK